MSTGYVRFFEKAGEKTDDEFLSFLKPVDSTIEYDPEELATGIKVEHEHTNNAKIAEIIAKQHLAEDPKYYSKLKTLNL
jgi:hypothetical protein